MSFFSPSSHRASSRHASARRLPARPLALLTPVAVLAVLAGCASPQPHPYADLASTPVLRPNPSDERGHMPYRLPKTVDWGQYGAVIVEPVIVYRGADHQFEDLSEDDKVVLAGDMRRAFADQLRTRFRLTTVPDAGTLRVRLTLTGSISYVVEILDASTQELLGAYVAKQYPNAWNLGATFGRLDAARVGIDKGAEELLAQLR